MRRWWWLPFLCLLTLIATLPMWRVPAPFYFLDDGFLHLFRVYEFDSVLRQGILYPRWAPDLAYGYGYPLFNYYPPLAYFVAEVWHLLGLTIADAIKATFVTVIFIGAAGALALGRDLFRDTIVANWAGALVALAYVFFPYFMIDLYIRGAVAESFAAAFLPWLFFAIRRTIQRPTLGLVIVTALFAALLVLSHNLTVLLAVPFLGAFVVFELFRSRTNRLRALLALSAAAILGALLSAIYWLPLLAEISLVAVSRQSRELGNIVQFSVLALTDLVQTDPAYVYREAPFALPLVPLCLAALALLIAVIKRRGSVIFFALVALVGAIMMTDFTSPIWLGVPALRSVQFPWRLQVFVGLGVAVAIGSLVTSLANFARMQTLGARLLRSRNAIALLIVIVLGAILMISALANLLPKPLNNPRDDIALDQLIRFEINSHNVGLGTMDEYMPLTVRFLPQRMEPSTAIVPLPTIRAEEYTAIRRALTVTADQTTTVSLHAFYFPDWQVKIDGKSVTAAPTTALGLLSFDVPIGEHRVEIVLTDTPPRQIANIFFWIGVSILILVLIVLIRRRAQELPLIFVILGMILLGLGLLASVAFTSQIPPLQSTQINLASELNLIGLQIDGARLESNEWRVTDSRATLTVIPYWHVKHSLAEQPIAWRLIDSNGHVVSQRNQLPRAAAGMSTTWVPNEIVQDYYELSLVNVPRGTYALQVTLDARNPFATVGTIVLERDGVHITEPTITHSINTRVGNDLHLLGYNLDSAPQRGRDLNVTLFWKTDRDVPEDLTAFLHLIDQDGNLVAQQDGLTDDGFNPTSLWQPDSIVPDRHTLKFPTTLKPGVYRLEAGLYHSETVVRLPVMNANGEVSEDDVANLGEIKIPMKAQDAQPQHATSVSFGSAIQFLGYDQSVSNTQLKIKLYWQARAQTDADYKVFVHVVDSTGQVVTQQDQIPGEGNYPVRIWDFGERVLDAYTLPLSDLPSGNYQIVIGMYAADSGERLPVLDLNGNESPNREVILESLNWVR